MWTQVSPPRALEQASELAHRAIALDDTVAAAHQVLSRVYLIKGPQALDQAIAEGERAVALEPNNPDCYVDLAYLLLDVYWALKGGPTAMVDEAVSLLKQAMRLHPRHEPGYLVALGDAYIVKGRYEEAIGAFKKALSREAWNLDARIELAFAYLFLDREEDARAEAAEILRLYPDLNLEGLKQPYNDPAELVHALKAQRDAWLGSEQ